MYDQAFTAQNGITANGDPLTPVDGVDIEGGIKKTFFGGKLKTSLGVYQITKQNLANPDNVNPLKGKGPDGIPYTDDDTNPEEGTETFPYFVQFGEIQSKGVEFDMQGQITPELNVVLNYANTNVEITEDTDAAKVGQRIAGHAKHVTNAWVNYNFSKISKLNGFGASLGYQYQIDRSSWAWGANDQTDLPDYFRLDGAISWKNDKIKVQANINNLLNEYLYSGSNYGTYLYWQSEPGINGRITVSYTF
jgi:iron complex outermembrane receptor protein